MTFCILEDQRVELRSSPDYCVNISTFHGEEGAVFISLIDGTWI